MRMDDNMESKWKYYNHAAVPLTPPHQAPDFGPLEDGSIWNIDGKKPLLVRYTSDWGCKDYTGWWYVLRDTPFDISQLKTKRRYEITRGMRFFDVRAIRPSEYADALATVQEKALLSYTGKKRVRFNRMSFVQSISKNDERIDEGKLLFFAAFRRETKELCGFNYAYVHASYANLAVQKAIPEQEKYGLNAALVYAVLEALSEKLANGFYLTDGARSINHETHFQNYLEKYFGFRKVSCRLHIIYASRIRWMMRLLYPVRRLIWRWPKFHLLGAVLKMDEIARGDEKFLSDNVSGGSMIPSASPEPSDV